MPRRGSARRRARRVWIVLGVALVIEFIALFLGPYAVNASITISLSECPPPLANATQVLEGRLLVIVESLYMKVPGAKRVEPALEIYLENGSVRVVPLSIVNGSEVSMSSVVRVVNDFVGPIETVDLGDNVSGIFVPPRVMFYDRADREYVLRYFYPGISLVSEVRIKPLYHRYRIVVRINRSADIVLGLCSGNSCVYRQSHCAPPACTLQGVSREPFQYTVVTLRYECGLFTARFTNVYGQVRLYARDNYIWLLTLFGIVAAITVAVAICASKKFK